MFNKNKLTVKQLREYLGKFDQEAVVLLASDEELNTLYDVFEVSVFESDADKEVVLWGLHAREEQL